MMSSQSNHDGELSECLLSVATNYQRLLFPPTSPSTQRTHRPKEEEGSEFELVRYESEGLDRGHYVVKWETHCHTVYSNRRHRRFDALNTPREMIEAAIRKGLQGMIITDHDNVAGGLVGRRAARGYKDFTVIPGAEVTSCSGHILAIGIENNVPKGLTVEETVERIHDLGGIAVASHPFSSRVRPSLGEECLKTDGVEVFNSTNRGDSNRRALFLAQTRSRPATAGSDAHWQKTVGSAGIICNDPIEDITKCRAILFETYTSSWDMRVFNFRQLASALANRPLWK